MYGEKIKTIRELRGFSQQYMADELGIAQNSFSKIETGQTRLTADTLKKIAELLGVSPVDILSHHPALINFKSNTETIVTAPMEQWQSFQREFVEKMVASKDDEIQRLKEIITGLLKDKEVMLKLFCK